MKKYLLALYAIMLSACSMSLASCNSDNDEPDNDKISIAALDACIAVTPEMAEICDIKVSYTDSYGETKTVTMEKVKEKAKFSGPLSKNIDEWCIINFVEQFKNFPSTAELTIKFTYNGKKPSIQKANLVAVRDIYGICYNNKGNKIKDAILSFSEGGALDVAEDNWENQIKILNSKLQSITIAVDKDGNFRTRE